MLLSILYIAIKAKHNEKIANETVILRINIVELLLQEIVHFTYVDGFCKRFPVKSFISLFNVAQIDLRSCYNYAY